MIKPLDIVTEFIDRDEQTKIRYAIDDFLTLEQGTRPRQLYDYWMRLPRNQFGLPDENYCCPREMSSEVLSILGSWIETLSEDPLDYIMREHAENDFPGYGCELSNKPLSEFPDSLHAFSCAAEYLFCKTDREPVYQEITQTTGGIRRHYTRIMLPFDGKDGNVVRIYYAVRRIVPPHRLFHVDTRLEEA
jgi:hypothetical protein